MRLTCPLCGARDRREFHYYGSDDYLDRPAVDAAPAAWDDYLHNRDNPAGITRDLWYHEQGRAVAGGAAQYHHHEIPSVDLVAGRAGA